eukprot:scaffold1931_cov215-Ochromonas_danica.AAC.18
MSFFTDRPQTPSRLRRGGSSDEDSDGGGGRINRSSPFLPPCETTSSDTNEESDRSSSGREELSKRCGSGRSSTRFAAGKNFTTTTFFKVPAQRTTKEDDGMASSDYLSFATSPLSPSKPAFQQVISSTGHSSSKPSLSNHTNSSSYAQPYEKLPFRRSSTELLDNAGVTERCSDIDNIISFLRDKLRSIEEELPLLTQQLVEKRATLARRLCSFSETCNRMLEDIVQDMKLRLGHPR